MSHDHWHGGARKRGSALRMVSKCSDRPYRRAESMPVSCREAPGMRAASHLDRSDLRLHVGTWSKLRSTLSAMVMVAIRAPQSSFDALSRSIGLEAAAESLSSSSNCFFFASRSAARSMKRRRCSGLSRSSAFDSFPPVATLSLSVSGRGPFKSCCALRASPILVRLARW